MRYKLFVVLGTLVVVLTMAGCACPACPEPVPTPCCPPCPEAPCCSEIGGITLDFSTLPLQPGTLPAVFTFGDVDFTRIWNEIKFEQGSLWCWGSEQSLGVWHDATVKLDFCRLPCQVCNIVAEVDDHGPEGRLEGRLGDGTTQTEVCPDDRATLTLTTSADNPFISATLSGQEAEWFIVRLE